MRNENIDTTNFQKSKVCLKVSNLVALTNLADYIVKYIWGFF